METGWEVEKAEHWWQRQEGTAVCRTGAQMAGKLQPTSSPEALELTHSPLWGLTGCRELWLCTWLHCTAQISPKTLLHHSGVSEASDEVHYAIFTAKPYARCSIYEELGPYTVFFLTLPLFTDYTKRLENPVLTRLDERSREDLEKVVWNWKLGV